MVLGAATSVTSSRFWSIVRSIEVINRPKDAADVTGIPLITQLYAACVWALTTTSTSGLSLLTMSSSSGPEKFSHLSTSWKPRE